MNKLQIIMVDLNLIGHIKLGRISDQTCRRYVREVNQILKQENSDWKCFSAKEEDGSQILYRSPYNHQIMSEKDSSGNYLPDFSKLKKNAFSEEEAAYIDSVKERRQTVSPKLQGFAFCTIYVKKMACGHFELFQTAAHSYTELLDWFHVVYSDSNRKCTRCICNWPTVKTNLEKGTPDHD